MLSGNLELCTAIIGLAAAILALAAAALPLLRNKGRGGSARVIASGEVRTLAVSRDEPKQQTMSVDGIRQLLDVSQDEWSDRELRDELFARALARNPDSDPAEVAQRVRRLAAAMDRLAP